MGAVTTVDQAAFGIEALIADYRAERHEHRVAGRSVDAAACSVAIGALRRLQVRLGLKVAPYPEDFR